jgi:hypothetical protein
LSGKFAIESVGYPDFLGANLFASVRIRFAILTYELEQIGSILRANGAQHNP